MKDENSGSHSHWEVDVYSKHSLVQYKQAMKLISDYPFHGDEAILDIGSGDGKVTYEVALKVPRGSVLGLEQSEDMLAFSKNKYSHINNLKFIKGDAQKLMFTQQFNLVASFCCLHWPENKTAVFSGIYNALKTEGKALLTMPLGSNEFRKAAKATMADPKWQPYFINYKDPTIPIFDNNYREYAENVRFSIEKYMIIEQDDFFPSYDSLFGWMKAITPYCSQISDKNQKEIFMDAIVKQYLSEIGANSGEYLFRNNFVEMIIKK